MRRTIRPHHLLLLSAVTIGMAGSHVLEGQSRQILEESTRQHPSLDASSARANAVLDGLPLAFEPAGAGQDHFVVRAGTAKADIRRTSLTVVDGAEGGRIEISFGGASTDGRLVPEVRLPGRVHYLRGNKREDWRVDVPRFARVRGRDIYPGIDVEYYGTRQHLEYDFIVRPGADPDSIELRVTAEEAATITKDGELALRRGGVIQKKPVAFQTVGGVRRGVDASYVQRAAGTFGIQVGAYDPAIPLVIDPVVVYAFTQVAPGGVMDMVTDSTGALYLVGTAFWAFGGGGTACSPIPCTDGFVYKLNRAGTDLEFATLLVGSAQDDLSRIALDGAGNIHVAGITTSNDFPGATQPGVVVAQLAPDGSQVLNTHVEEIPSHFVSNRVLDLAVSSVGDAYAWVSRVFFPNTDCSNAVLLRVPLAGPAATIDGATHCAGGLPSDGFAVAVGPDDNVYISVIRVSGISLPLQGALIRERADGTTVYSTTQDWANVIAIAPNGDALNGRDRRLRSIGPTGDLRFDVTLPPEVAQWPTSRLAHIGVDAAGTILAVRCGRWSTPTPGSACAALHIDQTGALLKLELLDEPYDSVFTSDARGMLYAAQGSFTIRKYSFATAAFVSPPATAPVGTPLTWQATTSLTGSLEYAFYRHTAATGWVLVQPYSASNSHTWTPGVADFGAHNLQVFVREAGWPQPYEAWAGTQVQIVSPPTAVDAFVASTPTGFTGAPVTFNATASGGVAPLQYQFWRLHAGAWQIVQPYSTSSTFAWTPGPADAGTHTLQVWVRSPGSVAPYDAWRGLSFTVDSPPPPVIQSLVASPPAVPIGGTVTFTATASGSGPLQYRFWRLDSDGWKLGQDYGPSPTYSWTPGAGDVGAHAVQVWVRNSGSTALYDAWRAVDFSVVAPPPVTITSVARSVASPAQAGSPITWTTTASGGVGTLHYQFWRLDAGGWTLAQAYSPTNTYTWTPGAPDVGDHVLQVWVREAGSAAAYEAWRGDPFSVVHAPVTTPVLSASANAPFQPGQTVTWTAASAGGSGPLEYQFWRLDAGTWTMVQGYSSSATFTWTIGAADVGTHALQVFVRSTGAALPYQAWSGTGTFVVNP